MPLIVVFYERVNVIRIVQNLVRPTMRVNCIACTWKPTDYACLAKPDAITPIRMCVQSTWQKKYHKVTPANRLLVIHNRRVHIAIAKQRCITFMLRWVKWFRAFFMWELCSLTALGVSEIIHLVPIFTQACRHFAHFDMVLP